MNKMFCLIMFVSACKISMGQNLVPNGDFEQQTSCPIAFSQFNLVQSWMNPSTHLSASPDYYNQCSAGASVDVPNNWNGSNFQLSHSGDAYAGIILFSATIANSREYIEIPLTSSLIADSCYHFQMYINLVNLCRFTTDDIGVYFSSTPITGITNYFPLPFTPQITNNTGNFPDSLNWILVEGNYTAIGGENHLIIGNFKNDTFTNVVVVNNSSNYGDSYCLIDDVSLNQIPACATGISENENIHVEYFPNPFSIELTFETNNYEFSEIILYD